MPRNQFNWNEDDLRRQLDTATGFGWLPFFDAAARVNGFATPQLLALGSRESGSLWAFHPDGLIVGDHGDAIGILQLNKNSVPDAFDNQTPEKNLMRGAKLLAANARYLRNYAPNTPADVMERMIYASYNRGAHGAWLSYQVHGDPDFTTSHSNYGADCVARAQVFATLLSE